MADTITPPEAATGTIRLDVPDPSISAVRRRRAELHEAMVTLEAAVAAPAASARRWRAGMRGALTLLEMVLAAHVAGTESEHGLFAKIRNDHEWLNSKVERLRIEHDQIAEATEALFTACEDEENVEALREHALDVISRIARHRHRGADLIYEAYSVDVSVGD